MHDRLKRCPNKGEAGCSLVHDVVDRDERIAELEAQLVEASDMNTAQRKTIQELQAHNQRLQECGKNAVSDLRDLLHDQKPNKFDGCYDYDGEAARELQCVLNESSAQSLRHTQADSIIDCAIWLEATFPRTPGMVIILMQGRAEQIRKTGK